MKEGESLLSKSVKLAVEARDEFWDSKNEISQHGYNRALVAASVGCYGAYLADGSEYRYDYVQLGIFYLPFEESFSDF